MSEGGQQARDEGVMQKRLIDILRAIYFDDVVDDSDIEFLASALGLSKEFKKALEV